MPEDNNTIWFDSTFVAPTEGARNLDVDFETGDSTNIGNYSFPLVYYVSDATQNTLQDVLVSVFSSSASASVSGVVDISSYYNASDGTFISNVLTSLVEYSNNLDTISGTQNFNLEYATGYNVVSGTQESYVSSVIGRNMLSAENIYTQYNRPEALLEALSWWINYTNFSGNLTTSGTPIPFNNQVRDIIVRYNTGSLDKTPGDLNNFVDITFAGWVDFLFNTDVYSALLREMEIVGTEVTTISGGTPRLDLDIFSANLTASGILSDVYCSLLDYSKLMSDVAVRDGRIVRFDSDVYSTTLATKNIDMDIELYPLKITNFSLAPGEYTSASGFISVDVVDDTCPVSVSGTYILLAGEEVPITFIPITDGYRLVYDPVDDFASLEGPTLLRVHTENECGNWLEEDFFITFGILVEYENYINSGLDFGFNNSVVVRVLAEDMASCPTLGSLAWTFDSKDLENRDLTADITVLSLDQGEKDLSASVVSLSTAFFYGKHFEVVVTARDFSGNDMEPFVLNFTIEDKP